MNSIYHNLTKRCENLWKIEQDSPDHKILRNMIVCNQVWGEPVIRIVFMGKGVGCQNEINKFFRTKDLSKRFTKRKILNRLESRITDVIKGKADALI